MGKFMEKVKKIAKATLYYIGISTILAPGLSPIVWAGYLVSTFFNPKEKIEHYYFSVPMAYARHYIPPEDTLGFNSFQKAKIDSVALWVKKNAEKENVKKIKVSIVGVSSPEGEETKNDTLGLRRAELVAKELKRRFEALGVDINKVEMDVSSGGEAGNDDVKEFLRKRYGINVNTEREMDEAIRIIRSRGGKDAEELEAFLSQFRGAKGGVGARIEIEVESHPSGPSCKMPEGPSCKPPSFPKGPSCDWNLKGPSCEKEPRKKECIKNKGCAVYNDERLIIYYKDVNGNGRYDWRTDTLHIIVPPGTQPIELVPCPGDCSLKDSKEKFREFVRGLGRRKPTNFPNPPVRRLKRV